MHKIEEFKAGEIPTARRFNEIIDALKWLMNWSSSDSVNIAFDSTGFTADMVVEHGIWIKITGGGTGGKYAWTRLDGATGGTWVASAETGTTTADPAYEFLLNTTVPITGTAIVRGWRDPSTGELRFLWGKC